MKTITRYEFYNADAAQVFHCLDDLSVTGMHMTQSSAMMMGSKLNLEFLTNNHTGLGSKYRWTGKMIGLKMDFTVEVTKWIEGEEKVWETIGTSSMIIFSWYQMRLIVTQKNEITKAELSITYKPPKEWYFKILSFLFANLYCKWCLKNMLRDAKLKLKNQEYAFHAI
jgi:hypothetical protein